MKHLLPSLAVLLVATIPPLSVALGCESDTQCKGERICDRGRCVSPGMPAASGSARQVVATVNEKEISVQQIEDMLQRQPGLEPRGVPAASKRILEGLIDEELAVQQAVEQQLDRDPRVVSALGRARREILARAYADRVSERAARPTPEEVSQYYASKPALFAQRRIYALKEFMVESPADQREALAAKLQGVRSADEVSRALRAAHIKFTVRDVTQAAENLPLPVLDRLALLNEGQSLAFAVPIGLNVIIVTGVKAAPVTEEKARPAIEQFLLNERKRKLVSEEIKQLRAAARIEYKGPFATAPAGSASGVAAPMSASPAAASQ